MIKKMAVAKDPGNEMMAFEYYNPVGPRMQGPFAWPFKVLHDLFSNPPFVARGGEKIRQIRRFAESDKELARFYRENA